MRTVWLCLAGLLLVCAQAAAYDFQVVASQDAFTDSFYFNEAEGVTHPDKLWAGATVNYTAVPPSIDGTEFTRTYLQFDLSNVSAIDKAYLWMYRVDDDWGYNNPDRGNVTVYRETEPWNENTITWQNAPNFANNVAGNSIFIDEPGGGWVSWNVGTFAKQAQGGNLSLVLASREPFHIFDSLATDHKPFLGINVVPEPTACFLFVFGAAALGARRFGKRK